MIWISEGWHGYINRPLEQCLCSGWRRLQQVVAPRDKEMIPVILFVLFGVASIVGECQAAAVQLSSNLERAKA